MAEPLDKVIALPSDPDKQRCIRCGEDALDTGWECNECGYDCMPWYYPDGYKKTKEADNG